MAHREKRIKSLTRFHWYPADVAVNNVEEDVLALIATAHHVLESAGKLHSYHPQHRPSFLDLPPHKSIVNRGAFYGRRPADPARLKHDIIID